MATVSGFAGDLTGNWARNFTATVATTVSVGNRCSLAPSLCEHGLYITWTAGSLPRPTIRLYRKVSANPLKASIRKHRKLTIDYLTIFNIRGVLTIILLAYCFSFILVFGKSHRPSHLPALQPINRKQQTAKFKTLHFRQQVSLHGLLFFFEWDVHL